MMHKRVYKGISQGQHVLLLNMRRSLEIISLPLIRQGGSMSTTSNLPNAAKLKYRRSQLMNVASFHFSCGDFQKPRSIMSSLSILSITFCQYDASRSSTLSLQRRYECKPRATPRTA